VSVNPYAPPTAVVADLELPSDVGTEPPFFAVSVTKLVIMSLCTFSVYEVYWFYRQWKRIAEREQSGISPLARAIFTFFFCYQCFGHIRDFDAEADTGRRLAAGPLAIGWIVTTILWRLPDPYSWISMLSVVFLVPVQLHANRLNASANPAHDRNARFSTWNWVAVVVAVLMVMLAFTDMFLPDVE
jgi:hypothetical protein